MLFESIFYVEFVEKFRSYVDFINQGIPILFHIILNDCINTFYDYFSSIFPNLLYFFAVVIIILITSPLFLMP